MACIERTSPDVKAFRVAAALERYQTAVALLTCTDSGTDAVETLRQAFRVLRLECAGLPAVNVQWAAVLISHFEILSLLPPGARTLWQAPGLPPQAHVQRHQAHIDALARECRVLMHGRRPSRAAWRMQGLASGRVSPRR